MQQRVAVWVLAGVGLAVATGCERGAKTEQAAEPAAAAAPTPVPFYTPTPREWGQYLARMEAWMNEDAAERQREAGSTTDVTQALRRSFKFTPGFDQPMPTFEAPASWDTSYLVIPNTRDEDVMVAINGVPFGTLPSGRSYRIPVMRHTRNVIEFYVPERDLAAQKVNPLRRVARYTREVQ